MRRHGTARSSERVPQYQCPQRSFLPEDERARSAALHGPSRYLSALSEFDDEKLRALRVERDLSHIGIKGARDLLADFGLAENVWAYDFMHHRTHDGRSFRLLTIVDEYTRECLAIDVARKLNSEDVLDRLGKLFVRRGIPDNIRSDNGLSFRIYAETPILNKSSTKSFSAYIV